MPAPEFTHLTSTSTIRVHRAGSLLWSESYSMSTWIVQIFWEIEKTLCTVWSGFSRESNDWERTLLNSGSESLETKETEVHILDHSFELSDWKGVSQNGIWIVQMILTIEEASRGVESESLKLFEQLRISEYWFVFSHEISQCHHKMVQRQSNNQSERFNQCNRLWTSSRMRKVVCGREVPWLPLPFNFSKLQTKTTRVRA